MTTRALLKAVSLRGSSGLLAAPGSSGSCLAPFAVQTRGHKSIFDQDGGGISKDNHFRLKFQLNTDFQTSRDVDERMKAAVPDIPTPPPNFNHYNPGAHQIRLFFGYFFGGFFCHHSTSFDNVTDIFWKMEKWVFPF